MCLFKCHKNVQFKIRNYKHLKNTKNFIQNLNLLQSYINFRILDFCLSVSLKIINSFEKSSINFFIFIKSHSPEVNFMHILIKIALFMTRVLNIFFISTFLVKSFIHTIPCIILSWQSTEILNDYYLYSNSNKRNIL